MLGNSTLAALALLLGLSACATTRQQTASGGGIVSAADPRAAEAGAEILRNGGSAADAAFATLLALTVVEPQSSGIGGGGFLVYEDGDGSPETYDGRETAPAAANGQWFFEQGRPLTFPRVIPGGKSVGVPGNIRMMALAHAKHGRLPWSDLFKPAIRLARDGFQMSPLLHAMAAGAWETGAYAPAGRALFYQSDGKTPKPVGTLIRNPDLAVFLEQVARRGPNHFYTGQNASAIANAVQSARTNPAPLIVEDVRQYQAKQRPAVCGTYRSYRVCGMGPPSSGGTAVLAILKQLERFDLAALGPDDPRSWHLIAESMRLAYADRAKYLADADFIPVPVSGLTDSAYLSRRSALISPDRAMQKVQAGDPPGAPKVAIGITPDIPSTSHFVAVDRRGNVASLTSTIESVFGSGLVVNGYYLNNELTDFSLVPTGADGLPVANRVEAGKRPRSSMSPTIVYGPEGKVRLAIGAAGGPTIIAQVAKSIIAVVDWDMTASAALAAPTIYAPGEAIYVEPNTPLAAMAPMLRRMGHTVELRGSSKLNAVEYVNGRWFGAADPRSEGSSVTE
jgi:gamma-glutamyltranspeptidase/glutathione hydrolase